MRATWRYGVICAALVCGGFARGEDLAAIFSRLATGIGAIPYEDVLKGKAIETLEPAMGEGFPRFAAAMEGGFTLDELAPLVAHPEPGVRTLALLNLFALEDQAAFSAIHSLVNDSEVWPEPANADEEKVRPAIAWLARRMLEKIGYRSDSFEQAEEKLRFEDWAAARFGNPEWITWHHLRYGRALEGSRTPEEMLERVAVLRSEIDNLPERTRDWVMLSFFPIYSFLTYPIASEEEWAEAGRRIGSHDLLEFLTNGTRAGMTEPAIDPSGQTRHFLVIRGRSIFTEKDAEALHGLGLYLTAAEAKPEMASEWLREAMLRWKNRASDFEYGEVPAALLELQPESELEYVLDWFYGPENEFIVAYQYDFISSYYRRRPQEWDATMKAIISHPSFENLTVDSVGALFDHVGMGARTGREKFKKFTREPSETELRNVLRAHYGLPLVEKQPLALPDCLSETPEWTVEVPPAPQSLTVSPDGTRIALRSSGEGVVVLNAADGAKKVDLKVEGLVKLCQFADPGGSLMVVTDQGKLTEWDVMSGEMKRERLHLKKRINKISLDRACELLAVGTSDDISIISLRDNIIPHTLDMATESYGSFALSADGERLVVSPGLSKTLMLFDTETMAKPAIMNGHSKAASSVLFSPDGATLISGGRDTRVLVWNGQTGELQNEYQNSHGTALGFTHDSRHFFVKTAADVLAMIEVATGKAVAGFRIAGTIVDIAVGPGDSKLYIAVATAGASLSHRLECWQLPR